MTFSKFYFFGAVLALAFGSATLLAQAPAIPAAGAPDPQNERVNESLKRASAFLINAQDPKTGAITTNGKAETTMTSLAILALSAMGHQPADPSPEGQAMKRALDFVLSPGRQEADGYFGAADKSRMYGHGITTLMLAEMLGMGADERQDGLIREKCRKGLELILRAQRVPKNDAVRGGWRYTPDASDSDMSVTCWQTMALRAAKNAGMDVPKEAIDLAVRYIKNLYYSGDGKQPGTAGFGYSSRGRETSTTAEGLLALQVCGDYDSDEVKNSSDRLLRAGLKLGDRWFYYTAYYYAQGMYQRGDKHAAEGKRVIADLLLPIQNPDGSWQGRGGEENDCGKVYATSLSVLALAVKNHFLPIYQR